MTSDGGADKAVYNVGTICPTYVWLLISALNRVSLECQGNIETLGDHLTC
jgi:hypothetical protein